MNAEGYGWMHATSGMANVANESLQMPPRLDWTVTEYTGGEPAGSRVALLIVLQNKAL
jgi:hypothetical protein